MTLRRVKMVLIGVLVSVSSAVALEEEEYFTRERQRMVREDLAGRDITDAQVLAIMGRVPRHLFVGARYRRAAYADHPLPIGAGQTISQPYVVALMTQTLAIKKGDRVLEIGTGSGYQAAVLAEITDQVYTIEIRESLAQQAAQTLSRLGYSSVQVKQGDGYFGWEAYAPFDAIIITCAANHVPPLLLKQLRTGGKLLLPLGSTTYYQTLTLITKRPEGEEVTYLGGVAFVPMCGTAESR